MTCSQWQTRWALNPGPREGLAPLHFVLCRVKCMGYVWNLGPTEVNVLHNMEAVACGWRPKCSKTLPFWSIKVGMDMITAWYQLLCEFSFNPINDELVFPSFEMYARLQDMEQLQSILLQSLCLPSSHLCVPQGQNQSPRAIREWFGVRQGWVIGRDSHVWFLSYST